MLQAAQLEPACYYEPAIAIGLSIITTKTRPRNIIDAAAAAELQNSVRARQLRHLARGAVLCSEKRAVRDKALAKSLHISLVKVYSDLEVAGRGSFL